MPTELNRPYQRGDSVRLTISGGSIAAWVVDPAYDYDQVVVRMVGDDRDFPVAITDIEPISTDDFCGGCGQIGCGHG
jgi:hypothetical protein